MIYCISDIHGEYDKFMKMLDLIRFGDDDTLYVLGDVFDRGLEPVRTLQKIMEMPNAVFIIGNHELMALGILRRGFAGIVNADVAELDDDTFLDLINWYQNGGNTTIAELRKLGEEQVTALRTYLENSQAYVQLEVNGQRFLLVHSGIMHFDPEKDISEYTLRELVWARPDLSKPYFDDVITVMGHTPTQIIEGFDKPGRIFRKNGHIVIDCGASMGGSLGCLRLNDMEEFYI